MTREEKQKAINALKISAPVMAVTQEEFNDYIQTLNKIMDWLEQESRWIPVSERLPNFAGAYLVTRYFPNNVMNPTYLVDACFFDGTDTWHNDNRINHERKYLTNVVAWLEEPEPYKAESEEKMTHNVKVPENHIVIDFDIPDENDNRSQGIHLPYSYFGDPIEDINNTINEFIRQQREYKEKTLAEIIQKYDFIVGSMECKHKLTEILPEGATIAYSPYIEDPTMIYAIKKFDIIDLLFEPQESEE